MRILSVLKYAPRPFVLKAVLAFLLGLVLLLLGNAVGIGGYTMSEATWSITMIVAFMGWLLLAYFEHQIAGLRESAHALGLGAFHILSWGLELNIIAGFLAFVSIGFSALIVAAQLKEGE